MEALYVRNFPDELHKNARLRAVEEDLTLRELIIKALDEYLKAPTKKGTRFQKERNEK